MTTERTIVCRTCGATWDAVCSYKDLPLPCEQCNSTDTYSEVGASGFRLRGSGWAWDGYSSYPPGERHVNIGKPSAAEKRRAKKVIEDRREQGREAQKKK